MSFYSNTVKYNYGYITFLEYLFFYLQRNSIMTIVLLILLI